MSYYSMRSWPGHYRIVKFDDDLNVQAIYEMPGGKCSCFQAHRHTCRHREMIEMFESYSRCNKGYFYDYEEGQWYKPLANKR